MKAIFAYMPVVHAGVLTFLREHPDTPVLLLDNEAGKSVSPYLERDIRALSAEEIKKELQAHGVINVEVVHHESLAQQVQEYELLIVPNDEIIDFFLKTYAPNISTEIADVFLRWTKPISTTEFEIPADRTITTDSFAQEILNKLHDTASQSPDWWRQIAAALVKDGNVVASAHNKHYPSPHALTINGDPRSNLDAGQGPSVYTSIHAEACVIADAAREGIATKNADLYVTTFPCPACARLATEAGVARVFYQKGYSLLDAETILKQAGVEIILVQDS